MESKTEIFAATLALYLAPASSLLPLLTGTILYNLILVSFYIPVKLIFIHLHISMINCQCAIIHSDRMKQTTCDTYKKLALIHRELKSWDRGKTGYEKKYRSATFPSPPPPGLAQWGVDN